MQNAQTEPGCVSPKDRGSKQGKLVEQTVQIIVKLIEIDRQQLDRKAWKVKCYQTANQMNHQMINALRNCVSYNQSYATDSQCNR